VKTKLLVFALFMLLLTACSSKESDFSRILGTTNVNQALKLVIIDDAPFMACDIVSFRLENYSDETLFLSRITNVKVLTYSQDTWIELSNSIISNTYKMNLRPLSGERPGAGYFGVQVCTLRKPATVRVVIIATLPESGEEVASFVEIDILTETQ
jgi:hypothetical protein